MTIKVFIATLDIPDFFRLAMWFWGPSHTGNARS